MINVCVLLVMSQWSLYPAYRPVNIAGYTIQNLTSINGIPVQFDGSADIISLGTSILTNVSDEAFTADIEPDSQAN